MHFGNRNKLLTSFDIGLEQLPSIEAVEWREAEARALVADDAERIGTDGEAEWARLPTFVLVRILAVSRKWTWLGTVAAVCKRWRRVAMLVASSCQLRLDNLLKVDSPIGMTSGAMEALFGGNPLFANVPCVTASHMLGVKAAKLMPMLRTLQHCNMLYLSKCGINNECVQVICENMPQLRMLAIDWSIASLEILPVISHSLRHLSRLDFSARLITVDSFETPAADLLDRIAPMPKLVDLNLHNRFDMFRSQPSLFSKFLSRVPNLTVLDVTASISSEQLPSFKKTQSGAAVTGFAAAAGQVESAVPGTMLPHVGWLTPSDLRAVGRLTRLTRLRLSCANDTIVDAHLPLLASLKNLRELTLEGADTSVEALERLAERSCPNLVTPSRRKKVKIKRGKWRRRGQGGASGSSAGPSGPSGLN
ncbi:uncharacterized protein AMSG_02645 [Thecamonas trahens ATCC 50062]|uniref:Uncharacterized protein n=1 Tax=Thecamonas trahens ATCC 50062 TaxID=461836 RepID=A0A0L0D6D3_THETB|nr:hypothetical protein AMSG_02645 [Thecamonas trahens ATCC 50062]KNC47621.1 hypothetical protein AMSG_02645 [Thecamonas trahens ATCC 50062]|eukprot:XP_013759546.1 hypothetical protein AMSG_02645 [Thecamonas trahens ATCC 50062]